MLTAYYDLSQSPFSYDCVTFLMLTERERIRRGAEWIEIHFIPKYRMDGHSAGQLQMLHNVMVPLAWTLPKVHRVSIIDQRPKQPEENSFGWMNGLHGLNHFMQEYAAGNRPLRVHGNPLRDPRTHSKLVTMTLREAGYILERNSHSEEWLIAAEEIAAKGYRVIVLPDTKTAKDYPDTVLPPDVFINREAPHNLTSRMLLYSAARCNMGISNGPTWTAFAMGGDLTTNETSMVMLRPSCDTAPGESHTTPFLARFGIHKDCQLPNSSPLHRLVWKDDTTENIVAAFDSYIEETQECWDQQLSRLTHFWSGSSKASASASA